MAAIILIGEKIDSGAVEAKRLDTDIVYRLKIDSVAMLKGLSDFEK